MSAETTITRTLTHDDGQWAPEWLPGLIAPLAAGHANAVFGSRMPSSVARSTAGNTYA